MLLHQNQDAFADPTPFSSEIISTYIAQYLYKTEQDSAVGEFGLESFSVNVLSIQRTMTEKIMGLVKIAYEQDPVSELGRKIRHVYDIHQLAVFGEGMREWIESEDFIKMLSIVHNNDRSVHSGDSSWCDEPLSESSIFRDFGSYWEQVDAVWNKDFRSLLHHETLPDNHQIKEVFALLLQRLIKYDAAH